MIEQIPLALVIDDAVVVGPTAVVVLRHDQSLILIRSHRVLTHGIAEDLGVLPHVWIGEIVVAIILEGERTLRLTVGQVFQTMDTLHHKLAISPFERICRVVVSEFLHIGLEFGTKSCSPEDISVTIGSLQYTGVDAIDTLDILRLKDERTLGTVSDSDTDTKSHAFFKDRWEIEIVLPVSLDTVRRPHRIGIRFHPGYFVLGDNHTMIGPVGQVLG